MMLQRIGLVFVLGLLAVPSPAQLPPLRTTGGQINLIRPKNRGVQPRCTTVRTMPNMPATTTCESPRHSGGGVTGGQTDATGQAGSGTSPVMPAGKATPTP